MVIFHSYVKLPEGTQNSNHTGKCVQENDDQPGDLAVIYWFIIMYLFIISFL